MTRSEQVRQYRQDILDLLHKRGKEESFGRILKALGYADRRALLSRLQRMVEFQELSMVVKQEGARKIAYYTPLVRTSGTGYFRGAGAGTVEIIIRDPKKRVRSTPSWLTVHRMDDHPPIKHQGGQGALRTPFSGGSVLAHAGTDY